MMCGEAESTAIPRLSPLDDAQIESSGCFVDWSENGSKKLKIFFFTAFIAPSYRSVFDPLRNLLTGLRIFVSTPMEPDRDWKPEWGDLPVTVQKCWTFPASRQHEQGFSDKTWRHVPYDTLPLLIRHRPDLVISLQLRYRTLQPR